MKGFAAHLFVGLSLNFHLIKIQCGVSDVSAAYTKVNTKNVSPTITVVTLLELYKPPTMHCILVQSNNWWMRIVSIHPLAMGLFYGPCFPCLLWWNQYINSYAMNSHNYVGKSRGRNIDNISWHNLVGHIELYAIAVNRINM